MGHYHVEGGKSSLRSKKPNMCLVFEQDAESRIYEYILVCPTQKNHGRFPEWKPPPLLQAKKSGI